MLMQSTVADSAASRSASASSKGVFEVGMHERLAFAEMLLLGLQNVFGMTGMFVFPTLLGLAFNLAPAVSPPSCSRSCCCGCRSYRDLTPDHSEPFSP